MANKKNSDKGAKKQVEVNKTVKKNNKKDVKKKNTAKKSYIQEIKSEMKKVKWPTKEEMVKYSIAVLVFVILFGMYFYGVDALFAWISSLVKGL